MSAVLRHESGWFEYKDNEFGNMDLGYLAYFDCRLLRDLGGYKAGARFPTVYVWIHRMGLELMTEGVSGKPTTRKYVQLEPVIEK